MNLRGKLFLILFATSTFFIVALYIISSSILLKGYEAIEDHQLNQNILRLQEIIANEQQHLMNTVNAWSVWDESYKFALNRNQEFYKVNFLVDSIFDVRFSEVIFYDLKGNIILAQDYDYQARKYISPSADKIKRAQEFWKLHLADKSGVTVSGLSCTGDYFDFFTMNPILKGSGKGPAAGYMLVFRRIDDELIKKFENIIKFKLKMVTLKDTPLKERQISFIKMENEVLGYVKLPGVMYKNTLLIEMTMPRSIYLFGKKTIGTYLGLISLAAYFLVFVLFIIFERAVIKRIAQLKKDLNEISQDHATVNRVNVIGKDEIGDLASNINSTLQVLDQKQMIINRSSKLTALGEMAASIAHEINSPLSVIGGYAVRMSKMIARHELDYNQLNIIAQKINNNVFRIDKIIKSLRVIARDSEQEEKALTTIGAIFEDVHSLCQAKLNLRNIKLDLSELNPHLSVNVRPIQLAQVFVNLINNSIDAVEGQENAWIKIRAFENESSIVIQVIDSGEPIIPDIVDRIMDPFFTTKEAGKGTGLGLPISKGMIESHGGKLNLITHPHTCFEIVLPK